ncbi:MAG TPA: hypothetical protein VJY35_08740 [Candidatus Eisenbacteria bacterium]|nr:hypothetical protein [Candidatus Eisenbacteria bacterium]
MAIVGAVAALCVIAALTFRIFDTDFWQHLAVGRALWQTHAIPMVQVWCWPTWGEPYVLQSWVFRALVWPFWKLGGIEGLYVWRWLTTLGAFGLLWLTARRMGARGLSVFPVLVVAALVYRQRSMVRPETLVAVLLAGQLWLLESRRAVRTAPVWLPAALVAIALLWANVHISYWLGLVVLAVYALDEVLRRDRPARGPALWMVLLAAMAISFANPFGVRALAQPFEFLFARTDPMYRTIGELQPLDWRLNDRNGFFVLLLLWPLLLFGRAIGRRFDRVEVALFLVFTPLALLSQRFTGFWALVAAPFVARDLGEWIARRRWPSWASGTAARAGMAAALCVIATGVELTRRDFVPGVGLVDVMVPKAACDFVERHGIRGRSFNHFELGGYLAWRFWPDRERLPFATIHPEAMSAEARIAYFGALVDPRGWAALDAQHRFDWVLLRRVHSEGDFVLDFLDADTSFAPVFMDDAAALYVRRGGTLQAVADSFGFRVARAGERWLESLGPRLAQDPALGPVLEAEYARAASSSPLSSTAESQWANLMFMARRPLDARGHLERAHAVDRWLPNYHLRRGLIALAQDQPRDALRAFDAERRMMETAWLDMMSGSIHRRLGERDRARYFYARALKLDPALQAARDSLDALSPPRR